MKRHHILLSLFSVFVATTIQSPVRGELITNETPSYPSISVLGEFGAQSFGLSHFVDFGIALANDSSGNYYYATGNKIAKYNSAGVLQWSQSQAPVTTTNTVGGQTQYRYYDRWTNHLAGVLDMELGVYEGDLASLYAQKIVLDASGRVYLCALDLFHRDRSILVKFDGSTGEVLWAARVGYVPAQDSPTDNFISKVVGLAVLPDQSVAVLETGIGTRIHAFTRLVIFASDTNNYAAGTRIRENNFVHQDDGDSSYRISLGVGMAAAADGTLYYATYEGLDPGVYTGADPYENFGPDTIVVRKLASPYTGAPVEEAFNFTGGFIDSFGKQRVMAMNDLAIGPNGKIYILGSLKSSKNRREPMLMSFNPASLAVDLQPTSYSSSEFNGDLRELPGMKLFSTGTDSGDSLYLATGPIDRLRENQKLGGGYDWFFANSNPPDLFVAKVDASGNATWKSHELGSYVYHSFSDSADNIYFLGSDPGLLDTLNVYKYSNSGVLQFAQDFATDGDNETYGFQGLVNAAGEIVVGFPQVDPATYSTFESSLLRLENPVNIDGPAPPTINFPEFTASAHPGQVLTLSATPSNGQPVFFHIPVGSEGGNTAYVAVDGTSLVLLKPGLIGVQAYQPNGSNFIFSEIRYLAIFKRLQTLTFNTSTSVKFRKGKRVHLIASATSGLPVTFTAKGGAGNIVTKNGQQFLELKRAGKVTITASQSGNAFYERANSIAKEITIKK